MKIIDWKKYLIVFLITVFIFITAIYLSNYFNSKKIDDLKLIQDNISVDILSSETQFTLLEDLSCNDVNNSILSKELNSLAEKILYSEDNIGKNNSQIVYLKKYYFLLEIKDYLLMKQISQRCGLKTFSILYFYDNRENCTECTEQSYVLTSLREKYPGLRVYSFDYNSDLSAVGALISIHKIKKQLPAVVIGGEVYNGFKSMQDIESVLPKYIKSIATSTATTTKKTK